LKRLLITILGLWISIFAFCQISPKVQNYREVDLKAIHFGFSLGLNALDFTVQHNATGYMQDTLTADVTKLSPGFHVNIISEYRITDRWSLRFLPGLIFGQRNIIYWKGNKQSNAKFDRKMKLESNLLDFPLMLKYKAKRINNYRPYMVVGANVRYDMAAKKKYDEDEEVFIRLKRLDYYGEIGFGIDYYLTYFKFSTEFKVSFGAANVLADDPHPRNPEYFNAIERLNSSIFQFSMHFE
jgi:hypothetical protein